MAEVANAEGVTVEKERDGTIVRVMPFQPPKAVRLDRTRKDDAAAALAKWVAEQNAPQSQDK